MVTQSGKQQTGSVATGVYVLVVGGNFHHKCVWVATLSAVGGQLP